jgi:hypothetical protein
MQRRDGDVVEEAEAVSAIGLGMMSRRPHGAKGVLDPAGHHRVGGRQHGANGAQGRFPGAGRHHRVGVDINEIVRRRHVVERLNVAVVMGEPDRRKVAHGRLLPQQRREHLVTQHFFHRAQAVGALGMAGAGVMEEEGRMGEVQRVHKRLGEHPIRPAVPRLGIPCAVGRRGVRMTAGRRAGAQHFVQRPDISFFVHETQGGGVRQRRRPSHQPVEHLPAQRIFNRTQPGGALGMPFTGIMVREGRM